MRIAYIALGKLFYKDGGQDPSEIASAFAQDIIDRALASRKKNEWKTGGISSAAMMTRQSMSINGNTSPVNVRISAVTAGNTDDELIYVVSTESVGGLFSYNLPSKKETRTFHKERLQLSDMRKHPSENTIVCSQRWPDG